MVRRRVFGPLAVMTMVGCTGVQTTDRSPGQSVGRGSAQGGGQLTLPSDRGDRRPGFADRGPDASSMPAQEDAGVPDWQRRLISPRAVARPGAPAIALQGRRFEGTHRFDIIDVPPGVTVHRVGEDPPTWEFRDEAGKRIALLQEEDWHNVLRPDLAPPHTAPVWSEAAGRVSYVENWGGEAARIRCEHVLTPLRLYRVERRVEGTSFVVMGFVYEPTRYDPYDQLR